MKTCFFLVAKGIGAIYLLLLNAAASGAEIKVLSTTAIQEVAMILGEKFQKTSGHRVIFVFEPIGNMRKRMSSGEIGDVFIFPAAEVDKLVKEGKAAADDVRPIASSNLGVAVRKGTPKPDISSPEAFKLAMLAAKSIVIGDPSRGGTGTLHIFKMFEKLGIAEDMNRKLVFKKGGGAPGNAQAMVETDSNVGVGQLSEFAPVAAMEIVGQFPSDLNLISLFSAVVMRDTRDAVAAKAMIDFMRTPEAAVEMRAQGMAPAFP
jgi:molybdate transport system substrate-binding protein